MELLEVIQESEIGFLVEILIFSAKISFFCSKKVLDLPENDPLSQKIGFLSLIFIFRVKKLNLDVKKVVNLPKNDSECQKGAA